MHRFVVIALSLISALASAAHGQSPSIEPIHIAAGTVLTFYLQTRLNPTDGDALDVLPKGTVLHVKMLDSIDSSVNHDGAEFRGLIASSLISGEDVVVHSEAEVRGLLVLLRSRSHPEGFRYELLITRLTDRGNSYALTASLNPSFFDPSSQPAAAPKAETKENSKASGSANGKLPENSPKQL